jgi:hypothetical protein
MCKSECQTSDSWAQAHINSTYILPPHCRFETYGDGNACLVSNQPADNSTVWLSPAGKSSALFAVWSSVAVSITATGRVSWPHTRGLKWELLVPCTVICELPRNTKNVASTLFGALYPKRRVEGFFGAFGDCNGELWEITSIYTIPFYLAQ